MMSRASPLASKNCDSGFYFSLKYPQICDWLKPVAGSYHLLCPQHFCRTFPIVDDHVRDAVGETLYDLFMVRIIYLRFSPFLSSTISLMPYLYLIISPPPTHTHTFSPFLYNNYEISYFLILLMPLSLLSKKCNDFSCVQSNPETLYLNMSHVQADVLVSNKVNIPKRKLRVLVSTEQVK